MGIPLSDVGHLEAQRAAAQLSDVPLVAVWTSDQLRAHQTADAVAAEHGLTPQPERLLREQSLGDLEGRLGSELSEQPVPEGFDISEGRWGGGEASADVHQQITELVTRLRQRV